MVIDRIGNTSNDNKDLPVGLLGHRSSQHQSSSIQYMHHSVQSKRPASNIHDSTALTYIHGDMDSSAISESIHGNHSVQQVMHNTSIMAHSLSIGA